MQIAQFSLPLIPGMVRVAYLTPVTGYPGKQPPTGYVNLTAEEVFAIPFTESAPGDYDTILRGDGKNNYFVKTSHIHSRSAFRKPGLVPLPPFSNQGVCAGSINHLPGLCVSFACIPREKKLNQTNARWRSWRSIYSHSPAAEVVQTGPRPAAFVEMPGEGTYVAFTDKPRGILLRGITFQDAGVEFKPDCVYRGPGDIIWTGTNDLTVTDIAKARKTLPKFPAELKVGLIIRTPEFATIRVQGGYQRDSPLNEVHCRYITTDPETMNWVSHFCIDELPMNIPGRNEVERFVGLYERGNEFIDQVLVRHPLNRKDDISERCKDEPTVDLGGLIRSTRIGEREMPNRPFYVYNWSTHSLSRWRYYFRKDVNAVPPSRDRGSMNLLTWFSQQQEIPLKVRLEAGNLTDWERRDLASYYAARRAGGRPIAEVARSVGVSREFIETWGRQRMSPHICVSRKDLANTPPLYMKPVREDDMFFIKLIATAYPEANLGAWLMREIIRDNLTTPFKKDRSRGVLTTDDIATHFGVSRFATEMWLLAAWKKAGRRRALPERWPESILIAPPYTALLITALTNAAAKFIVSMVKDESRLDAILLEMATAS